MDGNIKNLINLIVPRINDNNLYNEDGNNVSLKTTDMISIRSLEEIEKITDDAKKSVTDYALMSCPISKYMSTNKGKKAGRYRLRSSSTIYSSYAINFRGIHESQVVDRGFGISPSLSLKIPAKFFLKSNLRKIGEVKKVKTKGEGSSYHTIEIGEYPKTKVPRDLEFQLETMYNGGHLRDGLKCTGRLYTRIINNLMQNYSQEIPEFEYEGEKYVRVTQCYDSLDKYSFEDGSVVGGLGCSHWIKVEPITFIITNYNEVAKGKTDVVELDSEEIIFSGISFYPERRHENSVLWQNSMIRAYLNSAKTIEMDGNPEYEAPLKFDFTNTGFLKQAFDMTREPTREYIFRENETSICSYALMGCVGIEKIVIPSHIECVGESAFSGCVNSQILIQLQNTETRFMRNAFDGIDLKFVYIKKDLENLILSTKEDSSLDNDYYKFEFNFDVFAKILENANFRENIMQLNDWKNSGKIRFIPPEYVLYTFPSSEMKNFYVNKNNQRWANLIKTIGFDQLKDNEKINSLTDLMKIYYAIGGFSENQGESETAFNYILQYVATDRKESDSVIKKAFNKISDSIGHEKDPIEKIAAIGEEIHERFDKINLKGPYNPKFAKFFMKYYHEDPDFMKFRLKNRDGLWLNTRDYLCDAHNAFSAIMRRYPYRDVNGNEERALLSPRFVAEHSIVVDYDKVEEGNEQLAEIVGRYGYSQEQFEIIQKIYNQAKNTKDQAVLCLDIPKNEEGITFRFLEKDDPLGFVLGDITNCCQHIGGVAESCVKDGYINPNSGFMVFEGVIPNEDGELEKMILGQAYVWYDPETKTVCLDNIEVPKKVLDKLRSGTKHGEVLSSKTFIEAVERASESILMAMNRKGIEVKKVTTGQGYNDLKKEIETRFGAPETKNLAKNRANNVYSDAKNAQYILKTYDEVTKMYGNAIFETLKEIQADLNDIEKANNTQKTEMGGA